MTHNESNAETNDIIEQGRAKARRYPHTRLASSSDGCVSHPISNRVTNGQHRQSKNTCDVGRRRWKGREGGREREKKREREGGGEKIKRVREREGARERERERKRGSKGKRRRGEWERER